MPERLGESASGGLPVHGHGRCAVTVALPDPQADPDAYNAYVLAVADLRQKRATEAATGQWCPTWTHQAIRHVQRNVDIDCPDHDDDGGAVGEDCRRFGRYDGKHIAAEANPAHALAEVALWRGVAERHVAQAGGLDRKICQSCRRTDTQSRFVTWPCADLLAVVAACRAYAGGQ